VRTKTQAIAIVSLGSAALALSVLGVHFVGARSVRQGSPVAHAATAKGRPSAPAVVQSDGQWAARSAPVRREAKSTVPRSTPVVTLIASEPEKEAPRRRGTLREKFQEEISSTSRGGHSDEGPVDGFANWFYSQRAYPENSIPADARHKALESAILSNGGLHSARKGAATPGSPAPQQTWVPLGPAALPNGQTDTTVGPANPVSGRVSAIAVNPSDPNIVYVGGAQGGVWKTTNALSATPTWTPLTDQQASLAVGDIVIDPVNPNIIYVGTGEPNGSCDSYYGKGILRSADGGTSWTLLGAGSGGPFNNQSISKILIDPVTAGSPTSTTLWASTALGFLSSGTEQCIAAPGGWNGAVWRSNDSGATWVLQNVPTGASAPNARIHDMALDPTNSNILYVAVRSVPSAANGGIWKSVNATAATPSFTKLAGGFPDTASAFPAIRRITLGIGGTAAPGTLYAALESVSGSALWGLYKTTDGGTTWSHVEATSGSATLSGTTLTATSGAFATDGSWPGRRLILSNFASARIASVTDSTHLTLSLSGNAAFTWSTGSYPAYCSGQCFYDMTIGVDPTDGAAATVYVGGNPHSFANSGPLGASHYVWRSTDGAATWTAISQGNATTGGVHTDDHKIAFDASTTPARIYDGNDGGIWRSDDQGASWVTMNTNVAITQFQGVSTHPTDQTIVLGGTQDNGTNLLNSSLVTPPDWFHADFGDGGQSLIDQSTPSRMFHTYFNQSFNFFGPAKSTVGGAGGPGTWDFVGCYFGYGSFYYNGMDPTDPVSFYAPLAEHPAFTPNVTYFGSNKLYRSPDPQPAVNGTPSWTPVSPALTKGGSAFLSAIGVLPFTNASGSPEVIYTGASDGRVEVATDVNGSGGMGTWTVIDNASLPNRFVTSIEVASSDATGNTAYVGFSGFNATAPAGHLFRTTDGLSGAATWTDLSGDLPDIPVNAIAVDPTQTPNFLYVGTDIGVFRSLNDGVHWSYLSEGFPVVAVFGLQRNATTGQIVASTHGRGMFQLNAVDFTPPICGGQVTGSNQFEGAATDNAAGDTGIASVQLQAGSTNLVVSSVTYLNPASVTFVVNTINHCQAGSGTVVVSDYNGNTCTTGVALTGDPVPPAPAASNTGPYCVGQTIQLNASTVSGATYAWTGPNGFTSSLQSPTIPGATAAAAGTYTVTATVNGCISAPASTSVVVNPLPTPVVIPDGPLTFCAGGSVTLDAGAGYASYLWAPGGQTTQTILVNASGSYTVTVTAATGCAGTSAPTVVTVNPTPPAPTASNTGPYCVGQTIHLNASTVSGATYAWAGPNGFTSSLQNPTIPNATAAAAGTYSVTATVNGCTSTAGNTSVVVNPLPTPVVIPDGPLTFCAGGSVTLDAEEGYASYLWAPGGQTTQTILVNTSGSYTVTVTAASGCQGTSAPTVVTVNPTPAPVLTASHCAAPNTSGLTASVPSNAGDTYNWTLTGGSIDSGQGSNAISFTSGGAGTPMSLSVVETSAASCAGTAAGTLQVDFNDVPSTDPFYTFVCAIGRDGITAGCGNGNYCRDNPVTRAQMAVFLLKAEHGPSYTPPACHGIFGDVPCPGGFAVNWIEQLSTEGITAGCGGGNYCPDNPVTRAQMAVFLLKAEHGPSYTPPACRGIFGDVPCPGGFAVNWIERLSAEGVTGGCGGGNYCPDDPSTRGQMAVFLAKTFNLQ
jgi:hypothetical protein